MPGRLGIERHYVQMMLGIVGRAMQAASRIDETMQREVSALPEGFRFELRVMPSGPGMCLERVGRDELVFLDDEHAREGDLTISFKHLAHAFLLLSFQESTSQAFARGRMTVHGDVGKAIRIVRCLNHLESLILPKAIAQLAVKRYPDIQWSEKIAGGARIYAKVVVDLVKGE